MSKLFFMIEKFKAFLKSLLILPISSYLIARTIPSESPITEYTCFEINDKCAKVPI